MKALLSNHPLLLFIFLFCNHPFWAIGQYTIKGQILDENNLPILGVKVWIEQNLKGSYSDKEGKFEIANLESATYVIHFRYLGYKKHKQMLILNDDTKLAPIQLIPDPLNLSEILITSPATSVDIMETPTTVSVLNDQQLQKIGAVGTADYLQYIPGIFAESSSGEVFGRVYTRGMSASAPENRGWYYVSLQEDGLPVSGTQARFSGPDMFFRADASVEKLEVVRGGAASITTANAPGGIVNFISKTGGDKFKGEVRLKTGLQGRGHRQGYGRADISLGGPFNKKNKSWTYHIGGFYRYDQGVRDISFPANVGGQIKVNIKKLFKNGYIKVYGKYLNDRNINYVHVPARGPSFQELPEMSLNYTALLPNVQSKLPDGRAGFPEARTVFRDFDSSKGIQNKSLTGGIEVNFELGKGWKLKNQTRMNRNTQDWSFWIGQSFDSLATRGIVLNLLSGAHPQQPYTIPMWGENRWYDTETGELLASYQMLPGKAVEVNTSLPMKAFFSQGSFFLQSDFFDVVNQFSVDKEVRKHSFSGTAYLAYSELEYDVFTSLAVATFESNPRALRGELTVWENIGQVDSSLTFLAGEEVQLTNTDGIGRHGGFNYGEGYGDSRVLAISINDHWKVSTKLNIEGGLRYEIRNNRGKKAQIMTGLPSFSGGLDSDFSTGYDNAVRINNGKYEHFNENHLFISYSLGANYQFLDQSAVFARYTQGNRPPDLTYYLNNFANRPISQEGAIENIRQMEAGYKHLGSRFSLFATGFFSDLSNVATINVIIGSQGVFHLPVLFNRHQTYGVEISSVWRPIPRSGLELEGSVTFQNPTMKKVQNWTKPDPASPNIPSSYTTFDYSGNQTPDNPKVMFHLTSSWHIPNQLASFSFRWKHIGRRAANDPNALFLSAFNTYDLITSWNVSSNIALNLMGTNIFNSTGIMHFSGKAELGTFRETVTSTDPNQIYMVRPVLPRAIYLQVNYSFD